MRKSRLPLPVIAAVVVVTAGFVVHRRAQGNVLVRNGEIAFARYDPRIGDTVTYIVNRDGSHLRELFAGKQTGAPHWSPNGTELALQAGLHNPCPPCAASTIIFNPDTRRYRILSPPDPNLSSNCSIWSPDGGRFACEGGSPDGRRNGLYTIRTSDGKGLTQITSYPGGDDVPIDYSPDGKQIVFGREGQNHTCTAKSALYVVNVNGGKLRRITPRGYCDDDGSWSPDGTKIAFASGEPANIYVVHPNGSGLSQIPINVSGNLGVGDVSWSPDGTKIAFILARQKASGSRQEGVYSANADGSDVHRVTSSPTFDHETDWGSHPLTT